MLGAGGFIGTNLCLALHRAGIAATGFGRAAAAPPALSGGTVVWRQGKFEEVADWDRVMAGHSHVFDLIGAGLPDSSNQDPARSVAESMPARVRLLEACQRARLRRVVLASSGGTVYGPVADSTPIPETAPTEPISAYGIGKLVAEKYLALGRHLHGLDYRVLRIANAYGPHQDAERGQGLVAAVLRRLLSDQEIAVWGDGLTVRDYIHVDDVVAAMLLAAFGETGPHRLFNIGSGTGRSVLSVIADAGRVLGRRPRIVHRPGRSADVPVNVLDCARLRDATGWRPRVGWTDGLARTADWLSGPG